MNLDTYLQANSPLVLHVTKYVYIHVQNVVEKANISTDKLLKWPLS